MTIRSKGVGHTFPPQNINAKSKIRESKLILFWAEVTKNWKEKKASTGMPAGLHSRLSDFRFFGGSSYKVRLETHGSVFCFVLFCISLSLSLPIFVFGWFSSNTRENVDQKALNSPYWQIRGFPVFEQDFHTWLISNRERVIFLTLVTLVSVKTKQLCLYHRGKPSFNGRYANEAMNI